MIYLKAFLRKFVTEKFFKKVTAYGLLILLFYVFKDFLGIFFLIFIFSYLFLTFGEFLKEKADLLVEKLFQSKKKRTIGKQLFCLNTIILLEYLIFVGIIIFTLSDLLPKLIGELSELPKTMPFIADQLHVITSELNELKKFNSEIGGTISDVVVTQDYDVLFDILKKLKSASIILLQILGALILSFVFIIDRQKVKKYLLQIKESNFGFLYKEYRIIIERIVTSFGLIFKAQSMIAGINALLTIAGLVCIGLIHGGSFPYLLTLGLIVFIAGFVPVLGVFLSSIPIFLVAFTMIGGYQVVIEVMLLIGIVHTIEAYYLNPKIVSSFIELPVSLTFIILIVSEHFFGVAGLLVGVSLFYFIISLFRDVDKIVTKTRKKVDDESLEV
ncbi:AI-2E family transporter [Candidatus Gracilibacteria bacterium 28_42_T64]|nr:AI-2E family transporter [Candidatus Gracilibacteria bacterium 28_42_T64]